MYVRECTAGYHLVYASLPEYQTVFHLKPSKLGVLGAKSALRYGSVQRFEKSSTDVQYGRKVRGVAAHVKWVCLWL